LDPYRRHKAHSKSIVAKGTELQLYFVMSTVTNLPTPKPERFEIPTLY